MRVIVLSRNMAEKYMKNDLNGEKTAIVSISTPGDSYPKFENKDLVDSIHFQFHDIEKKVLSIEPATRDDIKGLKNFIKYFAR